MDLSTVILSWQTIVVALSASVIITAAKWISDRSEDKFMDSKYIQRFLPLFPVAIAMLFSLAIRPDELQSITQGLIWSLIPGFAAVWGWKIFRTLFLEKIGIDIDDNDDKKKNNEIKKEKD
jgi:hypothetical protein